MSNLEPFSPVPCNFIGHRQSRSLTSSTPGSECNTNWEGRSRRIGQTLNRNKAHHSVSGMVPSSMLAGCPDVATLKLIDCSQPVPMCSRQLDARKCAMSRPVKSDRAICGTAELHSWFWFSFKLEHPRHPKTECNGATEYAPAGASPVTLLGSGLYLSEYRRPAAPPGHPHEEALANTTYTIGWVIGGIGKGSSSVAQDSGTGSVQPTGGRAFVCTSYDMVNW